MTTPLVELVRNCRSLRQRAEEAYQAERERTEAAAYEEQRQEEQKTRQSFAESLKRELDIDIHPDSISVRVEDRTDYTASVPYVAIEGITFTRYDSGELAVLQRCATSGCAEMVHYGVSSIEQLGFVLADKSGRLCSACWRAQHASASDDGRRMSRTERALIDALDNLIAERMAVGL